MVIMHQIRFWLELCFRPGWGSSQRFLRPPYVEFKGPTFKGREGKERGKGEEKRKKGDCRGRDWTGRKGTEAGERKRGEPSIRKFLATDFSGKI